MKLTSLFTVTFAASAILFTACDKKETVGASGGAAATKEDALANFKKGALEIDTLMGDMKAAGNPAVGMPKLKAAVEKINALKTDGIPEDLKESFVTVKNGTNEMYAIFKDMPEKEDEVMAYLGKLMADPAVGPKMQKLKVEGKAAGEKFKTTAAKYGIELKHVGDK